jgi:hypothetical protein
MLFNIRDLLFVQNAKRCFLNKMGLKDLVKKFKKYSDLSNLGIIVRRKFFNNCFDLVKK